MPVALNQFNGTRLNRVGAWGLVKSLNKVSDRPIKDHVLDRTFEKFWPELDNAYKMLFPDSHAAVRNVEQPIYIAPNPTSSLLGNPPSKKRRGKSDQTPEAQQGLFNGVKEE